MLLPARNRNGFTLIELLLVVSIIAIITGGIVPAFSTYMRDQDLTQGVEQVKNDLRSVQNRALTGAMSETQIGGNKVQYWGVRFTSGGATYDYFIADDNTACLPDNSQVQGSYSLSNSMTIRAASFQDSAAPGCVFFSFINGDITEENISGGLPVSIIVGATSATECRRINLNGSGLISMDTSEGCT